MYVCGARGVNGHPLGRARYRCGACWTCARATAGLVDAAQDMKVVGHIRVAQQREKKIGDISRVEAMGNTIILYRSVFQPFAFSSVCVAAGPRGTT